jgi:predicted dehydrogenase
MSGSAIISIGIIGCGEVSQVVHIPTITHMSDLFRIVYLCDVSPGALAHCAAKINYPVKTTTDARELTASESVDIVFIVNSDEFHAPHAVLALENNKYVFIEKPMALTLRDADIIIDAEKRSKGRVMVGYMVR